MEDHFLMGRYLKFRYLSAKTVWLTVIFFINMKTSQSCSNATIYGAFAAYVVGNQRELDMLEVRLSAR